MHTYNYVNALYNYCAMLKAGKIPYNVDSNKCD